ncbi:hypothetical protein AVEN_38965-1 [Araneus ventricosus]|uniref:Uncharacterized protein n=1 Tax=Araneus ventricosus TaxID=182803 RepID=A0A4Y2MQ40_ARAVE|nr:hypothetical protein AVEN_38965-1 [Araneus ventricosus]
MIPRTIKPMPTNKYADKFPCPIEYEEKVCPQVPNYYFGLYRCYPYLMIPQTIKPIPTNKYADKFPCPIEYEEKVCPQILSKKGFLRQFRIASKPGAEKKDLATDVLGKVHCL